MRITVLDDDHGERIIPGREHITVLLNGEEVKHCLTADDVAGEVVSFVTDEDGRLVVEKGVVKKKTLHGIVKINRRFVNS